MKLKPTTLLFSALLAGAAVAVALLLPRTLDSRRVLEVERSATPTPTADVRSLSLIHI